MIKDGMVVIEARLHPLPLILQKNGWLVVFVVFLTRSIIGFENVYTQKL
jgi:hypothetical protein